MSDELYMRRALELAANGRFTTDPNPNVGCVIVNRGIIVGEGWHHKAGEGHAEVNALRQAGELARGATAYVTLEPCSHFGRTPPCCDALINAGVVSVIAAMQDPNPQVAGRGLTRLHQAGVKVDFGLLADEAEQLNRGFFKRMRTGFPWVQLKLAASLDGRTALVNGESQWITSEQARQDVQTFRAQASAILTTSRTILADNPQMNVRWSQLPTEAQQLIGDESLLRQPIRVVLDRQQHVTAQQKLFNTPAENWCITTHEGNVAPVWSKKFILPEHRGGIDLVALMMTLGRQQVNTVWVEAGASLAGSLLQAGVVDELIVYLAPKLLGSDARGLCSLPGLTQLSEAPQFYFTDMQQVGSDLRVILHPE